jgi:pimeloyl-ACP methyl ester carboxylesterase
MWTGRTVDLGGSRSLHAAQAGEGPDLVFLHGALTTGHDWMEGPAAALAADHRVTVVDRPGHGASRRPRFAGTPRDQARQIADGLERLGVGRATLVAHSFGSMVAFAMAEQLRERVSGLVLVAPIAFNEMRLIEQTVLAPRAIPLIGPLLSSLGELTRADRAFLEIVQRLMFSPAPIPPRWRETFPWKDVLDAGAMTAEGEDTAAILPLSPAGTLAHSSIALPAVILAGAADLIVDKERQARPLAAALPHAELRVVAEAGHMLHHSHAVEVIEAVRDVSRHRAETSA